MHSTPFRTPGPLRRIFLAAAICIPIACLLGIWGLWPWMMDLHARLEPWKIAGYWFGDLTALLFFAWFLASSLVFGVRPIPAHVERRLRRATAIGMGLGLAIDIGVNVYIDRADEAGYASGVVTTAQVQAVRKSDAPYILDCRYVDASGTQRRTNLRVFEDRKAPPPDGLDVRERSELRTRRVPFTIRIRYDPAWPQRCWIEGAGTKHSNDLVTMSHCMAILQALLVPIFLVAPVGAGHGPEALVYPMHRLLNAIPLAMEAALLAFFGMLAGLGRMGLGP